ADNSASKALSIVHPDVVAGQISIAGTLQGGESVQLSWETRNQGSGDAGTVTDSVYLSRDGQLTGATLLGQFVHTSIAAGTASSGSLSASLPEPAEGNYQILVVTDAGKVLTETGAGEANNIASVAALVAPDYFADLVVTSVSAPMQVIDDPA